MLMDNVPKSIFSSYIRAELSETIKTTTITTIINIQVSLQCLVFLPPFIIAFLKIWSKEINDHICQVYEQQAKKASTWLKRSWFLVKISSLLNVNLSKRIIIVFCSPHQSIRIFNKHQSNNKSSWAIKAIFVSVQYDRINTKSNLIKTVLGK